MALLVQCDTCKGEGWIGGGTVLAVVPWSHLRGMQAAKDGWIYPALCPTCQQRGILLAPDIGERAAFMGWQPKPMPSIS